MNFGKRAYFKNQKFFSKKGSIWIFLAMQLNQSDNQQ